MYIAVVIVIILLFVYKCPWAYELTAVALLFVYFQLCHERPDEPLVMKGGGVSKANTVRKITIFDPEFNLREITKQLVLLEDHLFHKNKHCVDCISKHFLTVEGLAEEARTLDREYKFAEVIDQVLSIKEYMGPFIERLKRESNVPQEAYAEIAQRLRLLRKPLARKYADIY
jgi:hypothetical protein